MLSKFLRIFSRRDRAEDNKFYPNVSIDKLISIPELQDEYRDKLRDDYAWRLSIKRLWTDTRKRWYAVRSEWKWNKDE